ncbi:lysozyme inhibitor LprI family protein [Altererythrobacter litoralis]|uniref:Lysozyme inhibitor LprI family protein n=1 Tax=Altererythrobacter litoralis TaxID=3113904 RepID=A0ABU7GGL2_9SPHN|nr:lysozyme inhibitor LprI family protein [Erythrobacteraceae bacterium 1XM1-14]
MALFSMTGCSDLGLGIGEVECLTTDGHEAVFAVFKEQVERQLSDELKGEYRIDRGKIRASIKQLKFEIADVRTSKEDPNSTKKYCTGSLNVAFSASALDEADEALAAVEAGSVSDFADQYDYRRNANSFSIPIDYTVQPTDDNEVVFAEVEDGESAFEFISRLVGAQLLRTKVVNEQNERLRFEAEQAKAERDANAAVLAASLAEAKASNQLAEQAINATWRALSQETRDQLLLVQRAWIKKKDTTCRLEAAQSSVEDTEREIANLNCLARFNTDRTRFLESYLEYAYD